MANYKPNTKGVIARDMIVPRPSGRRKSLGVVIAIIAASQVLLLAAIFALAEWVLAAYITLAIGLILTVGFLLLFYLVLSKNASPVATPVFFLELDKVSSVIMDKEEKVYTNNPRIEVIYTQTISFKSRRSITLKYSENSIKTDHFPTMKNKENIPYHRATTKALVEGDNCYLLFVEGNDKIIDIFDTKYYVPSPTDFVERNGRYYLN